MGKRKEPERMPEPDPETMVVVSIMVIAAVLIAFATIWMVT